MYIVSVLDNGQERDLLAASVTLNKDSLLINANGVVHLFAPSQLIDLIIIEDTPDIGASVIMETSRRVFLKKAPGSVN